MNFWGVITLKCNRGECQINKSSKNTDYENISQML